MKILVTNVYSYKNKGDAAIVVALVSEIRRAWQNPDILIQTTDITHDDGQYGAPIASSLPWIMLSSRRSDVLLVRLTSLIGQLLGLIVYLGARRHFHLRLDGILTKSLSAFVRQIDQTDLIIACGGGYLRTASSSPSNAILLLVTCLNFLAGYYLRKPTYLYSQSIGPVHGWLQRLILHFSLNRVSLIEPREGITERFLHQLQLNPPIQRTADPVFLLRGQSRPAPVKLQPAKIQVGITVRSWFGGDQRLDRYIQAFAATIDYLAEYQNAHIYYLPQVIAANFGDDDRLIAERVQRQLHHPQAFTLLTQDLHPLELVELCSRFDFFIGTRMHSNIFALINEVPVIAIEYEHKTRGIMEALGLGEMVVSINDVTAPLLQDRVEKLMTRRHHYQAIIHANLPGQIAQSRHAIELIKQDYDAPAK